jgi:modulator of FtsH protease HflC
MSLLSPRLGGGRVVFAALIAMGIVTFGNMFAWVPETRQGVIVRSGAVVGLVNPLMINKKPVTSAAGLIAKTPFLDQIVWMDRTARDVRLEAAQIMTADQQPVNIAAVARYRIVDPARLYGKVGTQQRATDALQPLFGRVLRESLEKLPLNDVLAAERGPSLATIRQALNAVAEPYGVTMTNVEILRTSLPDGKPMDQLYANMRAMALARAHDVDLEGRQRAQQIIAKADADAAAVFANSAGRDPAFYKFYRALQSYETTFGNGQSTKPAGTTRFVIGTGNDYLRVFRDGR